MQNLCTISIVNWYFKNLSCWINVMWLGNFLTRLYTIYLHAVQMLIYAAGTRVEIVCASLFIFP